MKTTFILLSLIIVGCGPAIVRDSKPGFSINFKDEFTIALGTGSAKNGMKTAKLYSNRDLILEVFDSSSVSESCPLGYFQKKLHVNHEVFSDIIRYVNKSRIMSLHREYSGDKSDGKQMVLVIRQNNDIKTIYCSNYFPVELNELEMKISRAIHVSEVCHDWKQIKNHDRLDLELWQEVK